MQVLLFSHLLGAGLTLLLISEAELILLKGKESQYQSVFTSIALAGVLQFISGSGLVILNPAATGLAATCAKFTVYLSVIIAIEGLLYLRIRKIQTGTLAEKIAISSLGISLIFISLTINLLI